MSVKKTCRDRDRVMAGGMGGGGGGGGTDEEQKERIPSTWTEWASLSKWREGARRPGQIHRSKPGVEEDSTHTREEANNGSQSLIGGSS